MSGISHVISQLTLPALLSSRYDWFKMLFHEVWNIQSPPPGLWPFPGGLSSHTLLWLWAHVPAENNHVGWIIFFPVRHLPNLDVGQFSPWSPPHPPVMNGLAGARRAEGKGWGERQEFYHINVSHFKLLLNLSIFMSLLPIPMRLLVKPGHSALSVLQAHGFFSLSEIPFIYMVLNLFFSPI